MDLVAVKNASSAQEYASRASSSFSQLFAAFIDCKKPMVALVNGPAVGMGVTVLGLCDTVYSVDTATFAAPFTALGICLEGASSYSFPRIIGYSKASSLLVLNEKINAAKAFEWGLVAEVIPKENFEKETRRKLRVMSELPIKSLLYSKDLVRGRERCLLHAGNEREREGLLEFLQCEEFTNNVKNFFARKKK
jgi:peroxisomal 3,2-trans-enoyl-CoA isomerase